MSEQAQQPRGDSVRLRERMFPEPNHPPACPAEIGIHPAIPGHIARDFGVPVYDVGSWHSQVPRAAMPKAAVDKHREPLSSKYEIRLPRQRLMPPPARDAVRAKDRDDQQLRAAIPMGTDRAHNR